MVFRLDWRSGFVPFDVKGPTTMTTNLRNRTPLRRKRRGFTLTEIAIVLGIVGLILGAIWVAAAAVYNNLRTSHANTEILQVAQAIRTLYANSASDAALTVGNLISANAVPNDMVSGAALVDPFPAGATTVLPTTSNDGFIISMTGVSLGSCIDLLMGVGGANRDPGLTAA